MAQSLEWIRSASETAAEQQSAEASGFAPKSIIRIAIGDATARAGGNLVVSGVSALLTLTDTVGTSLTDARTLAGVQGTFLTPAPQESGTERHGLAVPVPTALSLIKRRANLTWDEVGKLFRVSRRAVHLWASGEALSPGNEESVRFAFSRVLELDGKLPHEIRWILLNEYGVESLPVSDKSLPTTINPGAILEADQTRIGGPERILRRRKRSGNRPG